MPVSIPRRHRRRPRTPRTPALINAVGEDAFFAAYRDGESALDAVAAAWIGFASLPATADSPKY
jgi:hypothetical protein